MARIRTIKPEFPQSESIGRLSRDARLLFLQLFTLADDFGRLRAAIPVLAGQLYPYDADAVGLLDTWLSELTQQDHIQVYSADGTRYLQIIGWSKHQRTDNAAKSRIPSPPIAADPATAPLDFGNPPQPAAVRREPPQPAATRGLDLGPSTKERKKDSVGPSGPTMAGGKRISEVEDDFNKLFWKPYPRTPNMARKEALSAWLKLLPADREAAVQAIPKYIAWLKSKPDHPTVHAVRFITQRRFEGFLEPPEPGTGEVLMRHGDVAPASAGRLAGYIYYLRDTPEWDLWQTYNRKNGRKSSPADRCGGWLFPARSPPT